MSVNFKGYSTIGTNDKEASEIFYDAVLAQLEPKKLLANDRITMWLSPDDGSVLLAIAIPYDGESANHGNGTMKAIALESHDEVTKMYDKAIEMGATDDGAPGMRAGQFYGAYVYDLDGNKLCFFNMGG